MSYQFPAVARQKRNPEIINKFGERLRELRKEKGLSQNELAHAADIEYSQVSRIELGKINTSISQIAALSDALGVHPKELLGFEW